MVQKNADNPFDGTLFQGYVFILFSRYFLIKYGGLV
jgi:hypothetical protein